MADKESEGEKVLKTEVQPEQPLTDQERDWGLSALNDFAKGNYATCLQTLGKLETARPTDLKVAHNKAIVEYYKSELKKTDQFRKNMNAVCGQGKILIEGVESIKTVDHCVINFNQAVILFHLKQYGSALKIMNKIFTFIEPMEESLAHRVCLLLIELHLCTHQPAAALNLIGYIETQFVCTDSVISSDKDIMKPLEKEHREKKPVVSVDAATDAFRLKLLQYRARCYLMMRQLKACKRELKTLLSTSGPSVPSVFLKSNLEYLRRNYKKALKVLNSVPHSNLQFKDVGESMGVYFHNNSGCLHHHISKPNLANYYLNKALQENESAMQSLPKPEPAEPNSGRPLQTLGSNKRYELMYNLGVALIYSGRPVQAFDCLTESVQIYHMNPRLWHRLAECCILAHKARNEDDFNLALKRSNLVYSIVGTGQHKKIILTPKLNRDTKYSSEGQGFAVGLLVASLEFGSLCLRNALLLLPDESPPVTEATAEGGCPGFYAAPSTPMDAAEVASLRSSVLVASAYVSLCLGEYVVALGHAKELLAQPKLSGKHKLLGHLYASESLILLDRLSDAIQHLRPDLANHINVELTPGETDVDPSSEQTKPLSESLILLDRLSDAIQHLRPDLANHINVELTPGETDVDPSSEQTKPLSAWYPDTVATAKTVLQYNLAVTYALRGELDKSTEMLQHIWMSKSPGCDVPIHVVMLALYVELQLGHSDVSRSIVKQHLPQYR